MFSLTTSSTPQTFPSYPIEVPMSSFSNNEGNNWPSRFPPSDAVPRDAPSFENYVPPNETLQIPSSTSGTAEVYDNSYSPAGTAEPSYDLSYFSWTNPSRPPNPHVRIDTSLVPGQPAQNQYPSPGSQSIALLPVSPVSPILSNMNTSQFSPGAAPNSYLMYNSLEHLVHPDYTHTQLQSPEVMSQHGSSSPPSTPLSGRHESDGESAQQAFISSTDGPARPLYTHRQQLQMFKDAVILPGNDFWGPFIPQHMYRPHTNSDRRRYVEEVQLEGPIYFYCDSPAVCGISLEDALHCRTKHLINRDETVFHGRGPSVSIRLEWPGYRQWSRQIPTKDFRSPPGPITRSKLAKNIAKCVQRFICERKNHSLEDDTDSRWKVGDEPGRIHFEDLILVSVHHVSMGSWQPHLRLKRPIEHGHHRG